MANNTQKLFPPFALDSVNECLWNGTKAIKIRPKAFAVLNYLVDRPGQLVTKEELLGAVWPDTFVTDAVLKVTIRELREVLHDDPKVFALSKLHIDAVIDSSPCWIGLTPRPHHDASRIRLQLLSVAMARYHACTGGSTECYAASGRSLL